MLNVVLDGIFEASEDGEEGGGQLAEVVEYLQTHAHLGGVLINREVEWGRKGCGC